MSDYDGTINEFKNPIPPVLQGIIDKVTSYASKTIGGAHGQTRAQADALKSVLGAVGGLEQQKMEDAFGMKKLGIEQAGAMDRTKLEQAGALERTKISTEPSLLQAKGLTTPKYPASQQGLGMSNKANDSAFSTWESDYLKNNPFKDSWWD